MKKSVFVCGRAIEYELTRKKVKNINLRIKPDLSVNVSAPKKVPEKYIEAFIISKGEFIVRALEKYRIAKNDGKESAEYIDGDTVKILGKDIPVRVVKGQKNRALLSGGELVISAIHPEDREERKKAVLSYRRAGCEALINEICARVYPLFAKYGIAFPALRYRNMTSRWGSCQPRRGVITFNISLHAVPYECVEYVVFHEFTHFLHPDHSAAFYRRLSEFMPDYKERKKALSSFRCGV